MAQQNLFSKSLCALDLRASQYVFSIGLKIDPRRAWKLFVWAATAASLVCGIPAAVVLGSSLKEACRPLDSDGGALGAALALSAVFGMRTLLKLQSALNSSDLLRDPHSYLFEAVGITARDAWIGLRFLPALWQYSMFFVVATYFGNSMLPKSTYVFTVTLLSSTIFWLSLSLGCSRMRISYEYTQRRAWSVRVAVTFILGLTVLWATVQRGSGLLLEAISQRREGVEDSFPGIAVEWWVIVATMFLLAVGLGAYIERRTRIEAFLRPLNEAPMPTNDAWLRSGLGPRDARFLVESSFWRLPALSAVRGKATLSCCAAISMLLSFTVGHDLDHHVFVRVSEHKFYWSTLGMVCSVSWFFASEISQYVGPRANWEFFRLLIESGHSRFRVSTSYLLGLLYVCAIPALSSSVFMLLAVRPYLGVEFDGRAASLAFMACVAGVFCSVIAESLVGAYRGPKGMKNVELPEPALGLAFCALFSFALNECHFYASASIFVAFLVCGFVLMVRSSMERRV